MPGMPPAATGATAAQTTSPRKVMVQPLLVMTLPQNWDRSGYWGTISELHHEADAPDDFASAKIREPVTHLAIAGIRIGAAAHAAGRCAVVAPGRSDAA